MRARNKEFDHAIFVGTLFGPAPGDHREPRGFVVAHHEHDGRIVGLEPTREFGGRDVDGRGTRTHLQQPLAVCGFEPATLFPRRARVAHTHGHAKFSPLKKKSPGDG